MLLRPVRFGFAGVLANVGLTFKSFSAAAHTQHRSVPTCFHFLYFYDYALCVHFGFSV